MHLWRGGHDQAMVRRALKVELKLKHETGSRREAQLTLTNIGSDHFLPTGTPDRHLTVTFQLTDGRGKAIKKKKFTLKRSIIWRPFIIDWRDTRLEKNHPQRFSFSWEEVATNPGSSLTVTVRYHLLDEARRKRIGYQNSTPISYVLYQQSRSIGQEPQTAQ